MPVISNTGTVTPSTIVEQDVATIAGGPLDNLSVYVVGGTGGGGGPLEFAIYATVGGFRTRVAQAQIMGTDVPSLIDWQTGIGPLSGGSGGGGQTEQIDAGGTNYTVTVIDLSPSNLPRDPVMVTIAASDTFDTAADANFGAVFALAPGATGTLTVFPGYAQFMDVAIDQANLPPVTVTVTADCGVAPPSVLGTIVASVNMTGRDDSIASVFRGLKLPVATRYFVSITNQSRTSVAVTLTGVTYSESITSGGVVVLNGDVIGPSNNNTVIKWSNVPLLRLAPHGFAPGDLTTDAEIPIFDLALGTWRAFALSGDATMDNAGVVTINPAFVNTLTGNANGPSNANRFLSLLVPAVNVDVAIPDTRGWFFVEFSGLAAPHQVLLPAAPVAGEVVVVTDGDGSLGAETFNVNGNGKNVEGVPTFAMDNAYPGPFGSICLQYDGAAWVIFADYDRNAESGLFLAGNANGPSGQNRFLALTLLGNNADVTVSENEGWWWVRMINLGADHTVQLPGAPVNGEVVVVKDGDGSLKNFNIIIDGNGNDIDGSPSYTMTGIQNGLKGSVSMQFDAVAPNPGWFLF